MVVCTCRLFFFFFPVGNPALVSMYLYSNSPPGATATRARPRLVTGDAEIAFFLYDELHSLRTIAVTDRRRTKKSFASKPTTTTGPKNNKRSCSNAHGPSSRRQVRGDQVFESCEGVGEAATTLDHLVPNDYVRGTRCCQLICWCTVQWSSYCI